MCWQRLQLHEVGEAEARRMHGERLRIASLGSIKKGDGSFRVLHDGTHKVHLNPEIRARDQVDLPGIKEEKIIMRDLAARGCSGFSLVADVDKAHRRFHLLK